ncbi:hypothetical protein BRE01_28950 [Brevibacillus reuszeri]|uniref:Uncharacterized protein n=1 Tax=Brevibacillus reuszeri TaxID=54915 RepID=A0A0K9YJ47_9BACL|nr:hypothetical protein [Brevibacillus reuszeri]KNB68686.1 hypothetical protein ADS79_32480 [Brevibacillus reuszeri]MED1858977.1 hypothetical protein [Brevibacillus reuszeri]GED69193.1 hypothetical protein BRE01_28950 [Brevibacillus reuszeri]
MNETLLVKHAVGGRAFIDSGKDDISYEWEQTGEETRFTLALPHDERVAEIMKWKDELNVFLFQEQEGQPTKKIWFYVKDGPVTYDAASRQLTIVAQSKIEYIPEQFSTKL